MTFRKVYFENYGHSIAPLAESQWLFSLFELRTSSTTILSLRRLQYQANLQSLRRKNLISFLKLIFISDCQLRSSLNILELPPFKPSVSSGLTSKRSSFKSVRTSTKCPVCSVRRPLVSRFCLNLDFSAKRRTNDKVTVCICIV